MYIYIYIVPTYSQYEMTIYPASILGDPVMASGLQSQVCITSAIRCAWSSNPAARLPKMPDHFCGKDGQDRLAISGVSGDAGYTSNKDPSIMVLLGSDQCHSGKRCLSMGWGLFQGGDSTPCKICKMLCRVEVRVSRFVAGNPGDTEAKSEANWFR